MRTSTSVKGMALAALLAGAAPAAAALEVVSAAPQGALTGGELGRIQIVFSAAVVPLAQVEPAATAPPWLHISPPLPARWRWAGAAELVGEPLAPLPLATRYQVTVGTGLTAVSGESLTRPFRFTFETPPPHATVVAVPADRLEDTVENLLKGFSGWAGDEPEISPVVLVVFNQPVEATSLLERLTVRLAPAPVPNAEALLNASAVAALTPPQRAAWERFLLAAEGPPARVSPFTLRPWPADPQRAFLVEPPGGCWPAAARVEVAIAPGVASLEGPLAGGEGGGHFLTAAPFAPLSFSGPRAEVGEAFDPEEIALLFSSPVTWRDLTGKVQLRREGEERWQRAAVSRESWYWDWENRLLRLGDLGLAGGASYQVCVDETAHDAAGRELGFPWCATVRTGRRTPLAYLVEGDGVVEWEGPHVIPLRTRNVTRVNLGHRLLAQHEIVAALNDRGALPLPAGKEIPISASPDRSLLTPVDLDAALAGAPGVVLTRVQVAAVVEGSEYNEEDAQELRRPRFAISQVTSLGLTVKNSRHQGALVWVTRLADAAPVPGATVEVRSRTNQVVWTGETDADGLARVPAAVSREEGGVVIASVGKDWTYARTAWYAGHRGWEFNLPVDWEERPPVTGTVWADRGVVRPGETVHLKAVVRHQDELSLRPPETRTAVFVVRDSRGDDVHVREAPLDQWGAAEIALAVPAAAALGEWSALLTDAYDREARRPTGSWTVSGSLWVAEFRRPKMRVVVQPAAAQLVAGDALTATVQGALLAGGAMAGAPLRYVVRGERASSRPAGRRWEEFEVLPLAPGGEEEERPNELLAQGSGTLDAGGAATLRLERTASLASWPVRAEVEVEVEDVDRQRAAARAAVDILPGEFFVGVRRPPTFGEAAKGVRAEVVAVTAAGEPVPGVQLTVQLVRRHWESVRRREVSGRYVFESRPVDTPVATATLRTAEEPVGTVLAAEGGGEYALIVEGRDRRGNRLLAATWFYLLGPGYTPWRLDRENLLELVPEADRVAPGETARILVKSPWPRATGLVTVERAGVVEARLVELEGSMPVVEVPIRAQYAPNIFISVVMLRGRMDAAADPERIDPGRPAYRVGVCEIKVPARDRRLQVTVRPAKPEYRPGQKAAVEVTVTAAGGAPRRASVTLWAVDAGVLELTSYRPPDLVEVFFARRGLGVGTLDTRSSLVGRRSYGTKADAAGGGGGRESVGLEVRRDFRPVALWRGDLVTDERGRTTLAFALPDSLTTYRIMAVALAGAEEFGVGEAEVLATKPLGLEPAVPRFLRPGDEARASVVVRNRTRTAQEVEVTLQLEPGSAVQVRGGETRVARVAAGGSAEVGFGVRALGPGTALLRFSATASGGETDRMEVRLAVQPILPAETTATFFTVDGTALQTVEVPAAGDVFPGTGGLTVRVSASPLGGLHPSAVWLATYPYACAEQVASQVLGLTAAQRLGIGPAAVGEEGRPLPAFLEKAVARLTACQQGDGGFALWPGGGVSHPAVSAHVLWALAAARRAGTAVDEAVVARGAAYLSRLLRAAPAAQGPSWSTGVLAAHALVAVGKAEPAYFQGLMDQRRGAGSGWGRAVLAAAMRAVNPADPRASQLLQEVRNLLAVEARAAHLQEPAPTWGWEVFWGVGRGDAAALMAELAEGSGGELADRLARGLVERLTRGDGRTTQEVAWALQALATYRQRREGQPARGTVSATLAGQEVLRGELAAPPQDTAETTVSMTSLLAQGERLGRRLPLEVKFAGVGTAHASATLALASRRADRPALQQGLAVARRLVGAGGEAVEKVQAGEEVDLVVEVEAPAVRRFVAVEVPLPGGLEPLDPELATTARHLRRAAPLEDSEPPWWRPGFDHVERRDDRVLLFATTLAPGTTRLVVPCRATTPGRFAFAPARAEEMYAPEIFGTSPGGELQVLAAPR